MLSENDIHAIYYTNYTLYNKNSNNNDDEKKEGHQTPSARAVLCVFAWYVEII